jgi:hypothetical protein
MSDCSGEYTVILTIYLVVANVMERMAVSKQRWHIFHMERFDLEKLNEVEGKKKTSNRFVTL